MAEASLKVIQNSTRIDGKTVGDTLIDLGFPEAASHWPLQVFFHTGTVTGFLTAPTVSVGTNAPNYDNILAATTLPITVQDRTGVALPANSAASLSDGSTYCRVSVAATGTTFNFYVALTAIGLQLSSL